MFEINKTKQSIELINSKDQTKAIIDLSNQGGRLIHLESNGIDIISDLEHKSYETSQASSVLFPFANRIKNGEYQYKDKFYKLECNEPGRDNAIHGLVFDKQFELLDYSSNDDYADVRLSYTENNPPKGFPFPYKIDLTYRLEEAKLHLIVNIENIGKKSFPFNLGWHPYFCVNNFEHSYMVFDSHKQIIFDENLITQGTAETHIPKPYTLKGKALDDCFVLMDKKIEFHSEDYTVKIYGHPKSKYLQIYAPPGESRIAIEPMTGISDSFNHKKGLHKLKSGKTKSEHWTLEFNTKTQ